MVRKRIEKSNDTSLHTMVRRTSIAVQRTGVKDEQGREIVLACGYAKNGHFGYFIVRESKVGEQFIYGDQYAFFRKVNENSFKEALKALKETIEALPATSL